MEAELRGLVDVEDRRHTEDGLPMQEIQSNLIVDGLPTLVTVMDETGKLKFANRHALEFFDATLADLQGRPTADSFHPSDRAGVLESWAWSMRSGVSYDHDARQRRADGVYRWMRLRGHPMRDAHGNIFQWYFLQTDIDDARRATALSAGERRLLEMVAAGRPLPDTLAALCTLLDETADGCFGGILVFDGDFSTAQHSIGPGLSPDYNEALGRRAVSGFLGPCRMAAMEKQSVIVADAASDPRWNGNGWASLALKHGLKSCWSAPILSSTGESLGGFGVYSTSGGDPTPFHLALIDNLTHIASIAIERTRAEDARSRAAALLAGEKQLLEMLARGDSRSDVLDALCRLVESSTEDCHCSIVLADETGARAEHGAAPSLPETFINAIIGRPINTESGPCGMATFLAEPVVSNDLTKETRWPSWCPMALAHGLQACWSMPIMGANGKAMGAFAVYHKTPHVASTQLRNLIDQFKTIASIAIVRVQTDAALNRSEALLAQAQELSLTGSFACSVAADEHFWSRETFNIFGYESSTKISFKHIIARVHPEDVITIERAVECAMNGRGCDCECRLLLPDGTLKHIHIVAEGRCADNGMLECIGAIQDITDQRLSDEALSKVRSDIAHLGRVASLSALTASIAHEVNQPLSGIITNADTCVRMLAADPPNIAGAIMTAKRTIRDGNRAADVIHRLRALFAKEDMPCAPVDLNEAAREVIALTAIDLQRSHVTLRTEFDTDLPTVLGDRVQLQQVIVNLVHNARDAMDAVDDRPRCMTIRTLQDEDGVRLTVQDCGTGLTTHDAANAFEAFYTTKPNGMGIGLLVSRSIIERHLGRLWATQNDGHGATFSFSIPRSLPPSHLDGTILSLSDVVEHA